MTAQTGDRTDEEQAYWDRHREFCAHFRQEPPCPDCVRGLCPTALVFDARAEEAARVWGRKTGGWSWIP